MFRLIELTKSNQREPDMNIKQVHTCSLYLSSAVAVGGIV